MSNLMYDCLVIVIFLGYCSSSIGGVAWRAGCIITWQKGSLLIKYLSLVDHLVLINCLEKTHRMSTTQ